MQAKAKLIFFLTLFLGAGSLSAVCAQTAVDSMDCRQLVAALGDVKSLAFHSDEEAVAEALSKMIAGSTDPADEDLKICERNLFQTYRAQQLRQDIVACMYPYYLEAFGGNEENLRTALAGMLQRDGEVLMVMDRGARDFVVEIYKKMQAGKAAGQEGAAVLSDFLSGEKKRLQAVEEPQAYKAAIAVAGYEDFLRTTVKGLLPEGGAQSKKVQKLLDTTLPEVFARKLRVRGVSPSSLSPLLMGSPAYVALHETLFKAFFNCNQRAMLRSLKDKCAEWMLPQLAEAKEKDKERISPGYVYTKVEQLPRFPGGEAALLSYIGRNIKYPQSALENEIQGTVLLRFIVLEDGRIGDVEVLRRLDPACDKEAVRVVKGFPRFIPGKFKGKPVNAWYSLPIRFQIQ